MFLFDLSGYGMSLFRAHGVAIIPSREIDLSSLESLISLSIVAIKMEQHAAKGVLWHSSVNKVVETLFLLLYMLYMSTSIQSSFG